MLEIAVCDDDAVYILHEIFKSQNKTSMVRIDENGLTGCSYNFGYGEEAFGAHSNDKDSFYKKKATKKDDYEELWEEQRLERDWQKEKRNYSQKQTIANLYEKGTVVSESSIYGKAVIL